MDDLSEADLHALIIARDEQAFAEWERRTAPDALRTAQKRGLTWEDAEEIWNDAMNVVWSRAVQDPPIEPLGVGLRMYAFGVVGRMVANLKRRQQRQVPTYVLDDRDQLQDSGLWLPSQRPSKRVHALRRCMEMIDERSRITLELVLIGASPEEMSAALGISPNSVRKYVQRAKAAILKCLEGEIDV